MRKFKLFIVLTYLIPNVFAQIQPVNLKCEYLSNPEGIDMPDPRFYWQLESEVNGQFQTAYQLLVLVLRKNWIKMLAMPSILE